jgi:hypothetical protein
MHKFTVDYRARGDKPRGVLNRGIFINGIPRPLLTCRRFGHKAVIDGHGGPGEPGRAARWVACDRCGERPEPQGRLDPALWEVGEPYPKPGDPREATPSETNPGPWPTSNTWDLSIQILIGASYPGFSAEAKVGNCGSENATAAHLRLGRAFAIYINTGELGRWWQRRLNPVGYESKVVKVAVDRSRVRWNLGMPRDSYNKAWPRWRYGSFRWRPLDVLFGERRYTHEKVGKPVTAELVMPHGDRHEVTLQLQRRTVARKRTRSRFDGWAVDWDARAGIPTKPHGRGTVHGSGVRLDAANPESSAWALQALDQIRDNVSAMRTRYDYVPAQEGTDR